MSKPTQYGRIAVSIHCPKLKRVHVKLHPRLSEEPVYLVFEESPVTRTMHAGDFLRWNADKVWWDPITHEGKTYIDPVLVQSVPMTYDDKLAFKKLV